mgnify:CR=1 FL=1
MADTNTFKLQIISPDRVFYDDMVEMVELRTTEGDIGILKGHIPLTAVTVPGVLTIHKEGQLRQAAVHDGFLEILKDKVIVLAEACEWPEEIDINRAKEAKIRAERRISDNEEGTNLDRAEIALRKALLRIEVADKRGM